MQRTFEERYEEAMKKKGENWDVCMKMLRNLIRYTPNMTKDEFTWDQYYSVKIEIGSNLRSKGTMKA